MSRFLLPFVVCTALASSVALADDLLPAPPSSTQTPAQPDAQPPAQTPSQNPSQAPTQTPTQTPSTSPSAPGLSAAQQAVADARVACETDIQKLCPRVQPGGGRIYACLKQHKDRVSPACKQAVVNATKAPN
jgi:hypothetical protein